MSERQFIVLTRRPDGPFSEDVCALQTGPVAEPRDGQALVRVLMLSIDPYLRTAMNAEPAVGAPIPLGGLVPGRGLGQVVDSRSSALKAGDLVVGELGWQDKACVDASKLRVLPPTAHPLSWHLGVLGIPGITALLALELIGRPQVNETVFISSAAGTVGSAAGQIAKSFGCRTIGSASAAKRDLCRNTFGFDDCIDRASVAGLRHDIAEIADGIDILFDNVGDEMVSAIVPLMRPGGRIILCGRLAHYDQADSLPGSEQLLETILLRRLRVEGFNVREHADRFAASVSRLIGLADRGMLTQVDSIVHKLENAPRALCGLLNGHHTGKVVVQL